MTALTNKKLSAIIGKLDVLLQEYKKDRPEKKRDWRTYEERHARRIKVAMRELEPLVEEAVEPLQIAKGPGPNHVLTLKQRVLLLLLQRLFGESNRMMASMLAVFSVMSGMDTGYKSIERLYSDEEVSLALHNLHTVILRKKGVKSSDASGDGTGYSLTIKENYANEVQKRKEGVKEAAFTEGKMAFVYSFKIQDTRTQLYLAYGTSLRSEKCAFDKAMDLLLRIDVELSSIRLDRYYSCPSYVDALGKTKVYVIPKKNATLNGSWKWKRLMMEFADDPQAYFEEYFKRELSESGWSSDKRMLGWEIMQRKPERIDTADLCTMLWHNLIRLG